MKSFTFICLNHFFHKSLGDSKYFTTFIDDFDRKSWIYFLITKSQAFSNFNIFKGLVEKNDRQNFKVLKTNKEGELLFNEFNGFCNFHDIQKQLTIAHTPHQNGVVKRKNCTIVERAKTMAMENICPPQLWTKVVSITNYLIDRSPPRSHHGFIPIHVYSREPPILDHLIIFGCVICVHIEKSKRNKMQPNSSRCMFVGYDDRSKGYCYFNPLTKRVTISKRCGV